MLTGLGGHVAWAAPSACSGGGSKRATVASVPLSICCPPRPLLLGGSVQDFDPLDFFPFSHCMEMSPSAQLLGAAAWMAVRDAGNVHLDPAAAVWWGPPWRTRSSNRRCHVDRAEDLIPWRR